MSAIHINQCVSHAEWRTTYGPCSNQNDQKEGGWNTNKDSDTLLGAEPPAIAFLHLLHRQCVFLELWCQLSHLLRAGKEAFAIRQITHLFLSCPLCYLFYFVYLVLSLVYCALLDASVIVCVNTSEVCRKLLVEDIRSQVLLPLNELQVIRVVGRDSLVHLVKESLGSIHTIPNTRH